MKITRTLLTSACVGAAYLSFSSCKEKQMPTKPNIIFFLTDDQRNDILGCAGNTIIKTPVIDNLANSGVRFSNAFVTTSICAASRASIFTSMYERTHGYTFGQPPVAIKNMKTSYPVLLNNAGYYTGFIGKFGILVEGNNPDTLFDFYYPLFRAPYFKKQKDGTTRHLTEIVGDYAINFLDSVPKEEPFCLSISFNAAHAEDGDLKDHYPCPRSVEGMYDDIEMPQPRLSDTSIFNALPDFLKESMNRDRYFWRWDTPEKFQKNMRAYFSMISGIDRVIGKVLDELEKKGQKENTIIIYMGDNGYYMGDRGFAGKWTHYEQSLRVPLIIYDPRLPKEQQGTVLDEMALNVDVPATILDFCGINIPERFEGKSLLHILNGDTANWRHDFFCEHLMNHERIPKWEGVRGDRFVYARYFEQDPIYEFLLDLQTDPDELNNLANDSDYSDVLKKMSKRCDELKEKYEEMR